MFEKLSEAGFLSPLSFARHRVQELAWMKGTAGLKQRDVYSKKITSEEERKRFVLVLKDRLSFFPFEGKSFRLVHNGQPKKAKVESYPCTCRGPDEPHSHYFVRTSGLRAGDRIVIQRDAKGASRYFLQIIKHPQRS